MPFQQGVATEGAGRKGYEIEQDNLLRMNKILSKDLELIEKAQEEEALTEKQLKTLQLTKERVLKYLDKLHANRSESKVEVSVPQSLVDLIKLVRKQDEPTEEK